MRRSFRFTTLGLLTVAAAAGCSLVNSLDELRPADDGKFSGEPRPAPPGVVFEDAGFGPTGLTTDSGADAASQTEFSALVVGGEAAIGDSGTLAPVLTVLDSKTGIERGKRETMWIAGIAHDDVRDVWYIFEAPSYFVAAPTDTVKIHTRKLDLKTGLWTELSVFDGPPLVYYDAIAVTRERISYVAHPAAGNTKNRLVTLNTTDLAAPSVNSQIDLDELPRGMTGTPSLTGPGGNLSLVNLGLRSTPGDCATLDGGATRCKVRLRRFLIPNGGTPQPNGTALFGGMSAFGTPGVGSVICGGAPDDVVVMPGVGFDDQGKSQDGVQTLKTFDYSISSETGTVVFNMSTAVGAPTLLRKVAVDNQRRIVFVIEGNNDTSIYAVPLGAGLEPQKANLRHSGQSVYYDPASETAFAPFNQGEGKTFSAIKVSGGKAGAPIALKERQSSVTTPGGDWDPPSDLRPNILGISLTGQNCP